MSGSGPGANPAYSIYSVLAEEAVNLYRQVGDVASQIVINPVSAIALHQGDLATAERCAGEAAPIASGSGSEATALTNLADVIPTKGALGSAAAMLRRAVTRALDSGLENWFRIAVRNLAQVASRRGNHEDAALLIAASRYNSPAGDSTRRSLKALRARAAMRRAKPHSRRQLKRAWRWNSTSCSTWFCGIDRYSILGQSTPPFGMQLMLRSIEVGALQHRIEVFNLQERPVVAKLAP